MFESWREKWPLDKHVYSSYLSIVIDRYSFDERSISYRMTICGVTVDIWCWSFENWNALFNLKSVLLRKSR